MFHHGYFGRFFSPSYWFPALLNNQEAPYVIPDPTQLFPGFGGKVIQVVPIIQADESSASSSGADEEFSGIVDAGSCATVVVTISEQTGTLLDFSAQVQQSFDGVNWADLGSPLTAVGEKLLQTLTDGPHGLLRVKISATPESIDSSSSDPDIRTAITVMFIGWTLGL